MNAYEISIGIGIPFKYRYANSEEEVVEYMREYHPDYRRYRDMTLEERAESCEKFAFKDTYHIYILLPEVLERRINDYRDSKDDLIVKLDKTQNFLDQLLRVEK
jgi:hypothetical protein